jgi:Major Facilitator Superfamily
VAVDRRPAARVGAALGVAGRAGVRELTTVLGGAERTRVVVLLASVLALSTADATTVGASAMPLRHALGISNTDIGLLVTVTSLVAALASLPFGVLADRVRRTWTLAAAIVLWGGAMVWSATVASFHELLVTRALLGCVTAAAGPLVASLVGDDFPSRERGRIYGYILAGELAGAAVGFSVTSDIAALSWRAAFLLLALPAFVLAWMIFRLPEPARGGRAPLIAANAGPATAEPRSSDTDQATDAQRLARERGVDPDPELVLVGDPRSRTLDPADACPARSRMERGRGAHARRCLGPSHGARARRGVVASRLLAPRARVACVRAASGVPPRPYAHLCGYQLRLALHRPLPRRTTSVVRHGYLRKCRQEPTTLSANTQGAEALNRLWVSTLRALLSA